MKTGIETKMLANFRLKFCPLYVASALHIFLLLALRNETIYTSVYIEGAGFVLELRLGKTWRLNILTQMQLSSKTPPLIRGSHCIV